MASGDSKQFPPSMSAFERYLLGYIKELEKRYRVQLEFYKKAVEQITGKKVKEMILYSVALNDEYSMEEKDD